jgi:hypothetical protein
MLEDNELDNSLTVIREQKSVFLTDYVPFWSYSSVCGMRPRIPMWRMVISRFCDILIWMLTRDYVIDGIDELNNFRVSALIYMTVMVVPKNKTIN